jgi:DNA-binding response OmpR family regulator
MKILLLDDEQHLLNAIKRLLAELGHDVDCTTDAAKAVVMIESGGYDFALVDFMMPIHDGAWFMKNAHIPRDTKVLLMTANVDKEVIKEMFKLGVRGYLIKPLEKEELIKHLAFHSAGWQAPDSR